MSGKADKPEQNEVSEGLRLERRASEVGKKEVDKDLPMEKNQHMSFDALSDDPFLFLRRIPTNGETISTIHMDEAICHEILPN